MKVSLWLGPIVSVPSSGRPCSERTSDRKSTRLNSSHVRISYAVFCLEKNTTPLKTRHGCPPPGAFRRKRRPEPPHPPPAAAPRDVEEAPSPDSRRCGPPPPASQPRSR